MAKEAEKDRVKRWWDRLEQATKVYDEWETRFQCKTLVDYWEGKHWKGLPEEEAAKKYTINLVFPTIEIQLPSLLFYNPKVAIDPRPAHQDDQGSESGDRAKLCQDTVQTFIDDNDTYFKLMTTLALRNAEFRFGLVEVGYSADWLENPNAGKPILKENSDDQLTGENGQPITEPSKVIKAGSERIYLKSLPPENFRVSPSGRNVLQHNDWCAYFEWVYLSDVKANTKYKNTGKLKASGTLQGDKPTDDPDHEQHRGMGKLWKIWDFRTKTKHILMDGHDKFLVEDEPFTYFPIADLKYYERPNDWYPLPPVFNWISPQDEINEIRDQRRVRRRRSNRRYSVMKGSYAQPEIDKIADGEDGVIAERNTSEETLFPIADAPLGPDHDKDLMESHADFVQITGAGGDQRGGDPQDAGPGTETATQANIIETRTQLRESAGRHTVAAWLGQVCRLMLLCAVEKMQLPFWIQRNVDLTTLASGPDPQLLMTDPQAAMQQMLQVQQQIQKTTRLWTRITSDKLGPLNLDIAVDVASLSPVSEGQQRNDWMQVLALIGNPQAAMLLAQSQTLLRKTLGFYGIKQESDIQEITKVLTMTVQMQLLMAASQAQPPGKGTTPPGNQSQPPAGLPAAGPSIQ